MSTSDPPAEAETASRSWSHKGTPARIESILAAASEVLVRDGYTGFNLRKVAAAVGVRLATVQWHFPTREALLSAAIVKVLRDWGDGYQAIATRSDLSAEARLMAMQALSLDYMEAPSTVPLLFEFFAASQHEAFVRKIVRSEYREYRKFFANLLRDIRPDLGDGELIAWATVIIAQIEGLIFFMQADDAARPDAALVRRILERQFAAVLEVLKQGPPGRPPSPDNRD